MSRQRVSHYNYLEQHLQEFFEKMGLNQGQHQEIIGAYEDKAYSYRDEWEAAGIPFPHGVALYLLTYCYPFSLEVRETEQGWVAPRDWVIQHYPKYGALLPPVE